MNEFNAKVSSIRSRVEQAFGLLKGQFPSLKLFGTTHDIKDTYRAVEALMVVHNLCIDLGDEPEDIPHFDPSDLDMQREVVAGRFGEADAEDVPLADLEPVFGTDEELREAGYQMREEIFNSLFPPTA